MHGGSKKPHKPRPLVGTARAAREVIRAEAAILCDYDTCCERPDGCQAPASGEFPQTQTTRLADVVC